MNGEITGHAHVQDRSQLEIRSIEKSLPALKASGDMDIIKKLAATVKELSRKAAEAEKNINAAFVRQDAIQQEITEKKNQVKLIEDQNHVLELEKRGMDEYSDREKPKPFVKATKKIMPGTIIEGPNAMMKVREEITRSRIEEIRHVEGGYYSMEIRGL